MGYSALKFIIGDKLADPKTLMDGPDFLEVVMFSDCKGVRPIFDETGIMTQLICNLFNDMMILVQMRLQIPLSKRHKISSIDPKFPNYVKIRQRCSISSVTTHTGSQWSAQQQPSHLQTNVLYSISKKKCFSQQSTFRGLATHSLDASSFIWA